MEYQLFTQSLAETFADPFGSAQDRFRVFRGLNDFSRLMDEFDSIGEQ